VGDENEENLKQSDFKIPSHIAFDAKDSNHRCLHEYTKEKKEIKTNIFLIHTRIFVVSSINTLSELWLSWSLDSFHFYKFLKIEDWFVGM